MIIRIGEKKELGISTNGELLYGYRRKQVIGESGGGEFVAVS